MSCNRCTESNCLGTVLLHEKEYLGDIDNIKDKLKVKYGGVSFKLTVSPSSGEIFTRFYDLHVLSNGVEKNENC